MSTFSGLNGALTALQAQRRGLDVAGQNIANANTEGYSRQRVDLKSVGGPTVPAVHATWNGSGAGVNVAGINRSGDAFLEARGRAEHATGAYLDDQKQVYLNIEGVFAEPGATGLQSQLSNFWSSWGDVANNPSDEAARSQMLQRAGTVSDTLNGADAVLRSQWASTREQLGTLVMEVNTAAANVAELNEAVSRLQLAGSPNNELADQRDLLVMRLSELTGATATPREDGSVDVYLSGSMLVAGGTARALDVKGARRMDDLGAAPGQATGPVTLTWKGTDTNAVAASGRIASSMHTLANVLPNTVKNLDGVAQTLAKSVNDQHTAGYDLTGARGEDLYTPATGTTITAANIRVAIDDVSKVAAASQADNDAASPDPLNPALRPSLGGGNAQAMAGIASTTNNAYRELVVNLGVDSSNAQNRSATQTKLTQAVDTARLSETGVSLDEEMTDMLAYQRAYQAASQVITTINSTFDSLLQMIR